MAQNLVLFSDGTGNSAAKAQGTNVRRLYEAVERSATDPVQITYYDDGVGTQSFKPLRLLGGAFGYGISNNLRQLYGFLIRHHQHPDDKIFLFGFSRGAFTVRTLANMLWYVGLPACKGRTPEELDELAARALEAYKHRVPGDHTQGAPAAFRAQENAPIVPVEMLGVWDTVEAVGLPVKELTDACRTFIPLHFQPLRNGTTRRGVAQVESDLHPHLKHVYHALCIDDERLTFHPLLFEERREGKAWQERWPWFPSRDAAKEQVVEQVWFPGVHSNVGGGYPKDGLAYVSLKWMVDHAQGRGLILSPAQIQAFADRADVDDHEYEPRFGLGVFYRYAPRPIGTLCEDANVKPKVHASVFERIHRRTENYAPITLPEPVEVVAASPTFPGKGDPNARAKGLAECPAMINTGRWQYMAFVWLFTLLVLCFLFPPAPRPLPGAGFYAVVLAPLEGLVTDLARSMHVAWLANRVAAITNVPGLLSAFLGAGAFLLVWTWGLASHLKNVAGAAWGGSMLHPPQEKSVPCPLWLKLLMARPYTPGWITRAWGWTVTRLAPWVIRLGLAAIATLAGLFLVGKVVELGLSCIEAYRPAPPPTSSPSEPLSGRGMTRIPFATALPMVHSGIILNPGDEAHIVVKVETPWREGTLEATPQGLVARPPAAMAILVPYRRSWDSPWFTFMAQVGASRRHFAIGEGARIQAQSTGELRFFVNDVPGLYGNNQGTATLEIRVRRKPL